MRRKIFCFALLCPLSFFVSFAASVPAALVWHPSYNDTTLSDASIPPVASYESRKVGFFNRVKNKVFGFFVKKESKEINTGDKKKTMGLISVALLLVGLGIVFISGSLIPGGLLMLAGLYTTIKAIGMKREKKLVVENPNKDTGEKRKKTKWGLIIGLTLGVGALVGLFILANNWKFY